MADILEEIESKDPKIAWTLKAINGVGLSIEQMVEQAHNEVRTRKGVIAGMAATGPLVDKVKNEVMAAVDDTALEGEQAKVILSWLQKVREQIDTSVSLNQRELAIQEGIIEGIKKAAGKCEVLYKEQETKFRVRQNEAERGNRDEGGRPIGTRQFRDDEPEVPSPPVKRPRGRPRKVK